MSRLLRHQSSFIDDIAAHIAHTLTLLLTQLKIMDYQDQAVCALPSLLDEEGEGPTRTNARGAVVLHEADSDNFTASSRSEPSVAFSNTHPPDSTFASFSQQPSSVAAAISLAPLVMAKDPSPRARSKALRPADAPLAPLVMGKDPSPRARSKSLRPATSPRVVSTSHTPSTTSTHRARSAFDPAFRSMCPNPVLTRTRCISSESTSSTRSNVSPAVTSSAPQESCSLATVSPQAASQEEELCPPPSESARPVVFSPHDSTIVAPPREIFHVQEVYLVGDSPRTSSGLYTLEEEGEDDEDTLGSSWMMHQQQHQSIRRTSTVSFDDELDIEFGSNDCRHERKVHRCVHLGLIIGAVVCTIAGYMLLSSHMTKTRRNAGTAGNNSSSNNNNDAFNTPTQDIGDDDTAFWADNDEAITYLHELRFTVLGIDTFRAGPIELMATKWMTYTDRPPFGTRVPLEDLTRVVQRYALLVLHFANGGGKGWDEMMWANPGSHECEWVGVECNSKRHVEALDLGTNVDLTGVLMDEIGLLSSLTSLDLHHNRLEGSIPTSLYSLTNLTILNLEHNEFAGYIDDSIERLANLEELSLSYNYLSGTVPVSLQSIEFLKIFDIDTNRFEGEIWSFLPTWQYIEIFSIGSNALSGTIPTEIGELSQLHFIEFSYTATNGTIPTEVGLCPSLQGFRTFSSLVEGSIPSEIGNLLSLESFNVRGARLDYASTLPTELGFCTSLTDLAVSDSGLRGTIPSDLGQLTNLVALMMVGNKLEGTVPTELALLTNLRLLDMRGRYQELTGTLPEGICGIGLSGRLWMPDSVECSCCPDYR